MGSRRLVATEPESPVSADAPTVSITLPKTIICAGWSAPSVSEAIEPTVISATSKGVAF
jgi:hypothetical protein